MVSVIIPVYNVEEYVAACLDSVIGQSYTDLEIMIIDDGSTDGSGKICEDYAAKDARIRYIRTENHGLSDARNLGLEQCRGEYYSLVDSDDRLHPKAIEFAYRAMTEYKVPLVRTDFCLISDSENPAFQEYVYSNLPMTVHDCSSEIKELFSKGLRKVVWGCLYTKECLAGLTFESGRLHEDIMYTLQVLNRNQKMVRIEAPLYQYRIRTGSIDNQKKAGKEDLHRIEVGRQLIEFLLQNNPELTDVARAELLTVCVTRQIRIWKDGCDPEFAVLLPETIQETVRTAAKPRFRMLRNKDISLSRRLTCLGAMFSFTATCRLKQLALHVTRRKP